jgi:type III pantothenate kinase
MILLVDAGNTRIKWAGLEGGALQSGAAVLRRGAAEDVEALAAVWAALPAPQRLLIASVAGPDFSVHMQAWSKRFWGLEPEFISAEASAFGVRNAYIEPHRLGVDRWLALIAAHRLVPGPVCIVDCGTALTVDVIARDGEHLGGLIIPGLGLMRRALLEKTAGIGAVIGGVPHDEVSLFAKDTRSGVMGGTLYATIAVIDRIVQDVTEAIGTELTCVLTGGDADTVRPLLPADFRYEPELVLQGLALVAGAGL